MLSLSKHDFVEAWKRPRYFALASQVIQPPTMVITD